MKKVVPHNTSKAHLKWIKNCLSNRSQTGLSVGSHHWAGREGGGSSASPGLRLMALHIFINDLQANRKGTLFKLAGERLLSSLSPLEVSVLTESKVKTSHWGQGALALPAEGWNVSWGAASLGVAVDSPFIKSFHCQNMQKRCYWDLRIYLEVEVDMCRVGWNVCITGKKIVLILNIVAIWHF